MSDISPGNPELLTEQDIEYAHFKCCGDEDLVFLRCSACGHIWVQCYECDTWYVNLSDLCEMESALINSTSERLSCPCCHKPFDDFAYLSQEHVEKYLPTAQQVIEKGFGKHLSVSLRGKYGIA